MKKLCGKIGNFAKTRPSLFIVILIVLFVGFTFGSLEMLHATSTSKFCGMCHKDAQKGPGAEFYTWEKNVHAYVNVGCIDCHGTPGIVGYMKAKIGGMKDLYGEVVNSKEKKLEILTMGATNEAYAAKLVPNETCLFCHSDEANKEIRSNTMMSFMGREMRNLDMVVNPEFRVQNGLPDVFKDKMVGIDPNHSLHIKDLGLSCMNCHMGVAHGNEFNNKSKMETCFKCHDAERPKRPEAKMPANDSCASCHQLPLQEQEGAFLEDKGIPATPWLMPSITGDCASCHVDAVTLPTPQACVDCHDESYKDMYTAFRADFDTQKAEITPVWMNLYSNLEKMTPEQRTKFNELNYFMTIVNRDMSKSIHNTDLMNGILGKAKTMADELTVDMKL